MRYPRTICGNLDWKVNLFSRHSSRRPIITVAVSWTDVLPLLLAVIPVLDALLPCCLQAKVLMCSGVCLRQLQNDTTGGGLSKIGIYEVRFQREEEIRWSRRVGPSMKVTAQVTGGGAQLCRYIQAYRVICVTR